MSGPDDERDVVAAGCQRATRRHGLRPVGAFDGESGVREVVDGHDGRDGRRVPCGRAHGRIAVEGWLIRE